MDLTTSLRCRCLVLGLLGLLALLASAPGAAADLALGVRFGSQGLGLEGFTPMSREVNLRAVVSGFAISDERELTGVTYNADLRLASAGLLLDWHPYAGRFRLSAGILANANQVDLDSDCRPGCVVNGRALQASSADPGRIEGEMGFGSGASYLGLGWVFASRLTAWFWSAEAGVMFQNKPEAELSGSGTFVDSATGQPVPVATLEADLDAEQLELERDLETYDLYPVLALGFGYRF
jgi:hypothetical protein